MSLQETVRAVRRVFPAGTIVSREGGPSYQIYKSVDCGGEAIVYKAHALDDNRIVAVKMLYRLEEPDSDAMKRFERVRAIHAKIRGVNVLPVEDSGIFVMGNDSHPFFVSPFFSGGKTLNRVLHEAGSGNVTAKKRKGTLIPYVELLHYAVQVAIGLQTIHRYGVIHRDLKPDNILISGEGVGSLVSVMDLGVSKFSDEETTPEEHKITIGLCIRGTLEYLSPEAASGRPVHLSDIWAYGTILYQMVTGWSPFNFESGNTHDQVAKVAYALLEPLEIDDFCEGVDPQLVNLIKKCLMHDPADRPQSMEDILEALNRMQLSLPEVSMSDVPPSQFAINGGSAVNADAATLAAQSTPPKQVEIIDVQIPKAPLVAKISEPTVPDSSPVNEMTSKPPQRPPIKLEPVPNAWEEQTKITTGDIAQKDENPRRSYLPLIMTAVAIVALYFGYDAWVGAQQPANLQVNSVMLPLVHVAPSNSFAVSAPAKSQPVASVTAKAIASTKVADAEPLVAKPDASNVSPAVATAKPVATKAPPRPTKTKRPPSGHEPLRPGVDYIPGVDGL